jgi:hypothetical protein
LELGAGSVLRRVGNDYPITRLSNFPISPYQSPYLVPSIALVSDPLFTL